MKILHVYDYFAPGNSRFGLDLALRLKALGHQIHSLAAVGEDGPSSGTEIEGIPFHTYSYGFGKTGFSMFRYTRACNRDIFEQIQSKEKFDLVLYNQPLSASGVLSSPKSREIAHAYTFHSPWAAEWEVTYPQIGGIKKWFQMGTRNRVEDRVLQRCGSMMVLSQYMRNQLKKFHPSIPNDRIHIIGGGVDLDFFSPDGSREENRKKIGLPQAGPVLVTVRRLVPRMGIGNLIRAMPAVLERHPNVTLVIGGKGPIREELESLAKPMGDRIRFLGYVSEQDFPVLLRAADVFLLPTLELEGFGLVLIEAMACGTPALGTAVAAIPEVLREDSLFPGTDPESLTNGILRFLDSPSPERVRERVQKYDWKVVSKVAE
jgi:glycosyltransferase involved in cell wall biosynthesis